MRRNTLRRCAAPVSHAAKSHKDGQSSTVLWNLQNEHQLFERARTQMVNISSSHESPCPNRMNEGDIWLGFGMAIASGCASIFKNMLLAT